MRSVRTVCNKRHPVRRVAGISPFLLLAALALVIVGGTATSTAQAQDVPPDAVMALQETIVQTIAKAERSVVAISRSKSPTAAQLQQTQQRQRLIGGRIIVNGQALPSNPLNQLRSAQPITPPYAFGSGVVISDTGLILTQYLVVNSKDQHTVTDVQGNRYEATVLAADPRSGLAVLKVDPKQLAKVRDEQPEALPPLAIGKAEKLNKGQFVIAIGNPYTIESDGQPTTSWGTISNIGRKASADENLNNTKDTRNGFRTTLHHFGTLIQTDAKLGWNASGGALVNLSGELIGITTTAATIAGHEQPAGYAIPLNSTMRRVVESLSEGKEAEYGLIGITFQPIKLLSSRTNVFANPTNQKKAPQTTGVRIDKAYLGSPGYRGGLRAGDIVQRINGVPILDADSLQLAVGSCEPGQEVEVNYLRNGKETSGLVELGKAFVVGEQIITQKSPIWRGIRVDYSTAIPGNELALASAQGKVDAQGCVAIVEVVPGSVSERSGVKPYMFISHVGGKRVASPEEFHNATANAVDTVKIKFTQQLSAAQTP